MYEAVHAAPAGDATVARFALTAREYGYDGVVVRNHGDEQATFDPEAVAAATGVDVVEGVEVRARDPETASGYLGNYRPDHEIVAVHGGSTALNRFAVEQAAVDVLAHPMADDGDVNHVIANAAAEQGVRLEFNLRPVLRSTGGERVRAIQDLRKLAELVEDADAPFVVSADPRSHLQLRATRELRAVGEAVGLDADTVEHGLREWGRLAERNRERLAESFVEPGVRLVDGTDDGSHGRHASVADADGQGDDRGDPVDERHAAADDRGDSADRDDSVDDRRDSTADPDEPADDRDDPVDDGSGSRDDASAPAGDGA